MAFMAFTSHAILFSCLDSEQMKNQALQNARQAFNAHENWVSLHTQSKPHHRLVASCQFYCTTNIFHFRHCRLSFRIGQCSVQSLY